MNPQKYSGVALPFVFVIVAGIYGYWAVQRELVSSRPSTGRHEVPDPIPSPGVNTFHSRMWEDPLSTSYVDWKSRQSGNQPLKPKTVQDVDIPDENIRSAAQEALAEAEEPNENEEPAKVPGSDPDPGSDPTRAMKLLVRELVDKRDEGTICLPVFLPGGPYAEDKEKRMRIRYAVVTALAESGYHLKLSSQMSYVTPSVFVRVLWGWHEREFVVPVKLYRYEGAGERKPLADETKPQVLVVWIDESELGLRPLLATHRILNELFEKVDKRERLTVSMIGPASSGTLEIMESESLHLKGAAEAIDGTSPLTTLSGDALHWLISSYAKSKPLTPVGGFMPLLHSSGNGEANGDKVTMNIFSPRATKLIEKEQDREKWFGGSEYVKWNRVIGTDGQLAELLHTELKLRGAVPGHVVLITEHDTAYGRAIPRTFKQVFGESTIITPFAILRGIDGKVPGDTADVSSSPQAGSRISSTEIPEIVERPPEGRTQYDYLRRLARQIEKLSKDRKLSDVRAIGVVGSDVYDKLLVLRALKPQFPNCVFFTTDMDAIYSHANERQHTRNLLIASHFGLTLGELQNKTAPFRDSYQTATFLATRMAIHHSHQFFAKTDDGQNLSAERPESEKTVEQNLATVVHNWADGVDPILHVVGRNKIQRLHVPDRAEKLAEAAEGNDGEEAGRKADRKEIASIVHPGTSQSTGGWHYWFVAGLIFVAGCLVWGLLNRDMLRAAPLRHDHWKHTVNYPLGIMAGTGIVLLVAFAIRGNAGHEAASFVDGYSTWPTKFLYALTGIAAVVVVAYLINQWCVTLQETTRHNGRVGQHALNCFSGAHTFRIGTLALIIAYAGGAIVSPVDRHPFIWVLATITVLALAGAWCYAALRVPRVEDSNPTMPPADNLVLGTDIRVALGFALVCLVAVSIPGVVAGGAFESHYNRWYPVYISRGDYSRAGDWVANTYAFGSVGLLLSALLYLHLWCREFARHVPKALAAEQEDGAAKMHEEFGQPPDEQALIMTWKNEHDRLWTIGKLTSVTGKLAPALMLLLFLLVISHHPGLSPVSMPTSLLVLATLFVIVFVVSGLTLRWHFQSERDDTLAKLQLQLSNLHDTEKSDTASAAESKTAELQPHRELMERVDALMEVAENHGTQALAAATLMSTVLQSKPQPQGVDLNQVLATRKKEIAELSDGVFQSWNQSPMGWILGGGTTLALLDLWIRWSTIGL